MPDHGFTYQQDQFSIDDREEVNTECTGGVLIFSYCVIGLMALGYMAFAAWISNGLYVELASLDAGAKTVETEFGYGKLAVYLKDAIGIWPTTLLLFAALMSPVPVIYFQTRKAKQPALTVEETPAPTLPRFDDGTAKLILAGLAGVFFFAAGAIRFSLIPISVAAFLLVASPVLAIALRVHQGSSCE